MLYVCIYPAAFTATNRIVATKRRKTITKFWGYKCPSDKCNLCLQRKNERKGGAKS